MNASAVALQVLVLFLVMMVGWVSKKCKIVQDAGESSISGLVMNITLPCLAVTSFQREYDASTLKDVGLVVLVGIMIYIASFFLGMLVSKPLPKERRKVFWMAVLLSNSGYMGIPVVQAAMGESGLVHAVSHQIAFYVIVWTLGVMIFQGVQGISVKQILTKPGLIGLVVGLGFFIGGVRLPKVLFDAMDMIANMTTPLSMLLVGMQLSRAKWSDFNDKSVYALAAIRLALIPLATLAVMKLTGFSGPAANVELLIAGMPVAAILSVFAANFHSDEAYASQLIFITTTFSVITVPLLVMLM